VTGIITTYFSGVCEIIRSSQALFLGYFTPSVKFNFTDAQKVSEIREVRVIFRASVKSGFTADVLNAPSLVASLSLLLRGFYDTLYSTEPIRNET
jgi:hypothetical protein